jgi:hypothetical protein
MVDENKRKELEQRLYSEVVGFHDFVAQWFRGEVKDDPLLFEQHMKQKLAPDFINIQPSGQVLTNEDLLIPIFQAHGVNPDFDISIREFHLMFVGADGSFAVGRYIEDQTGARNTTPSNNSRISSVGFRLEDKILWQFCHETGLNAP